jgi:hypothetical protein
MTEKRKRPKITEGATVNEEFEEWLTGFCEGDGTVYLNDRGYPIVAFEQKERDVLDYISSVIAHGHFYVTEHTQRLQFHSSYCAPLLEMFSRHVVSMHFLERLNVVLVGVGLQSAVLHRPTADWFAGFWDAEGTSGNQPSIQVSQKERSVLEALRILFGGHIYCRSGGVHNWCLYGSRARALFREIESRSRCPAKAERLRNNFSGPTYHELHRDKYLAYFRERYKTRDTRKQVRDWMREHPEEVARVRGESI